MLQMEKAIVESVEEKKEEIEELKEELSESLKDLLEFQKQELDNCSKQLEILNPKAVLSRGYSISLSESGKPIKSYKDVKKSEKIATILEDGQIISEILETKGE